MKLHNTLTQFLLLAFLIAVAGYFLYNTLKVSEGFKGEYEDTEDTEDNEDNEDNELKE